MRAIIVIALLLLILGLFGWIQFSNSDGDPTIRLDTNKIEQDTSEIVDKSRDALNNATDTVDRSFQRKTIETTNPR